METISGLSRKDSCILEKILRICVLKKVYFILFLQLLLTFGMVALFVFVQEIKDFAQENIGLFWAAFGVSFALIIAMSCCPSVRRKTPHNYICLFLFTLAEGWLIGCAAATYEADEVMYAVGATLAVTLGLTLFAFQTKWDFTMMGGMLYVFLIVLFFFGIIAAIVQNNITNLVYACCGALLFSFYIVYDTQILIGGNHKLAISPEEYVFAALNIYLDVINLFMYLLQIIGLAKD
ncbi:unnamed protein product, partial [Meganyctiphanes norvegica]